MAYIPNTERDRGEMLAALGVRSLDAVFKDVPKARRRSAAEGVRHAGGVACPP